MPALSLTGNEIPKPIEKAVTFKDFVIITREIPKGLKLMRDTCLEGKLPLADVNCAAYLDQVAHYIGVMLRTPVEGEREYVVSLLRRMGPEEFEATKDIEALWQRAEKEYPDLAKSRAGPEFLEEELLDKYRGNVAKVLGARWSRVEEIQRGITGKAPPSTPAAPSPGSSPQPSTSTKESMKAELEEKMKRLRGSI